MKDKEKDGRDKLVSEMENVDLDGKLRATILSTRILNKIQCGIRNKGRKKRNKHSLIHTHTQWLVAISFAL